MILFTTRLNDQYKKEKLSIHSHHAIFKIRSKIALLLYIINYRIQLHIRK